ncbi:MAG: NEW3 domain-containing protein, partial [Planctomycetota bacterium]
AQTSGDQIRWSLGALAPGEERTLEMELSPVEEGEIGSVATVSFATQATARARCTRPQLAVRMTAPSRVLVGRQQRVSIELHNPGTGDATGVMLLENVPENLRHEAGAALEFEVGTLRAGETRTMELVMSAEKPGRVVNVLTARADGNLQVQQQVEFDVVAPDLAVGLQGPRRRYLERPATYTVSIENPGTAPAKDVRLVTRLPQGMRFIEANNFGEYDAASHSVYWSLAELPEGQKGAVQLTAMPVTSGELELEVEGQASEGLKDQDAMRVQIEGLAALNFEVIDVEDPIEVGGSTVYEVRVTNQGTKAATNVGVRVQIPAGMQAVKASGDTRNSVQNGAVVFAPLDRLPPQAEATFRVQVEGVQPGDQRVAVEVSSDDLAQPVRKEESTRVFGDE